MKAAFEPLLKFFGIKSTGNIFKDVDLLAGILENEQECMTKIFENIFDIYDTNHSKTIDAEELNVLLQDIGEAIGDEELQNLSEEKLQQILREVDTNKSGEIDKDEFIKFMIEWGAHGKHSK